MTDTKPWFKSEGLWGNLLGVMIVGAALLGVTPDVTATEEANQAVTLVAAFVAHLVGAHGRWTASSKIQ